MYNKSMSWLQKLLMEEDDDEILNISDNFIVEDEMPNTKTNTNTKNTSTHSNHSQTYDEVSSAAYTSAGGIGEVTRAQVIERNHLRNRKVSSASAVVESNDYDDADKNSVSVQSKPTTATFKDTINNDIWKTAKDAADIYGITPLLMAKYIKSAIDEDGLAAADLVIEVSQSHDTAAKAKAKPVKYYHIQLVIAAGFRVKGGAGQQFRQIATKIMTDNYLG